MKLATSVMPSKTNRSERAAVLPKQRVLVVDDEPDTLELIRFNLLGAGYQPITASDGAEALFKARTMAPDLIILDVMLPEMDGMEVCKVLRTNPSTARIPVLMLTARAEEVDRILGLELGARDYVSKPFSPRELLLRVRNILKQDDDAGEEGQTLQFEELFIDVPRHAVSVGRKVVDLTATEFRLLCLLARRRGRVQSRDQLLQDVWNYENAIDTRTVDTHMRRLRDKLGTAARFLETVRGVGYRFTER